MSNHNSGPVYGPLTQQGGHNNSVYNGTPPPPRDAASPGPGLGGGPRHALYSFADTVGYSHLSARLQKLSQHDLVDIVRRGVAEAGVRPGDVETQDQGDAQLIAFPQDTDTAKVLGVLPRFIDEELKVRNRDMAEHAQMRVRLAFAMGVSVPGAAGLVGDAPIAVARLANSDVFRKGMRVAPRARCGVLIDDYLHTQLVRQGFRADIDPEDYIPVRVQHPEKGFDARAWMKLFGYPGPETRFLLT
jgi:class 3 adenylate cyclase